MWRKGGGGDSFESCNIGIYTQTETVKYQPTLQAYGARALDGVIVDEIDINIYLGPDSGVLLV